MINMNEYFNHLDELDNKDAIRETTVDTLSNLPDYMSKVIGTKNEYNNVEIVGEVYIGSNVTIDSFTKIIGPVIINNNVEISTNVSCMMMIKEEKGIQFYLQKGRCLSL